VLSQNNLRWYAIRVRNQHEDVVAKHLTFRELECFLPVYRENHQWSDRSKEIDVPLFAGYVFCRLNLASRLAVLSVPGVVHIVGTGKCPTPIDEEEIAALQTAVRSGFRAHPSPFLAVGQKVRIEQGPLCGLEGFLLGFRAQQRIVLSITLLQRSVAVEINGAMVRPLAVRDGRAGLTHESASPVPQLSTL
jgi:transcription antitermination factor NusG